MAAEVSGVEVDDRGAAGVEAKEERPAGSKRAELATNSDFGVAGSGLEACGHRGCGGHLSAGSATNRLALFGARVRSRAERRPAAQTGAAA